MRTDRNPNWFFFRLEMVPAMRSGQRYCVFFNLRRRPEDEARVDPYWLSLFIESAYARDEKVGMSRRMPFGRLAEEIVIPKLTRR